MFYQTFKELSKGWLKHFRFFVLDILDGICRPTLVIICCAIDGGSGLFNF